MATRRYSIPRPSPVLDQFAELLSLEFSPAEAARQMGRSGSTGKDLLKRLRRRLGWQAQ